MSSAKEGALAAVSLVQVLCVLLILAIVVIGFLLTSKVYEDSKKAKTLSTASSICAAVSNSERISSYLPDGKLARLDNRFQAEVVRAVAESRTLDGTITTNGIPDAWGNSFIFEMTNSTNGQKVFSVISPGPDGLIDSQDDLIRRTAFFTQEERKN